MRAQPNLKLLWFCFTTLCDRSRNLKPPCQPIRCKRSIANQNIVDHVFSRSRHVTRVFIGSPAVFTLAVVGLLNSINETKRSPGPVTGKSGLCDLTGSFRSASFNFFLFLNRFSRNIGNECATKQDKRHCNFSIS